MKKLTYPATLQDAASALGLHESTLRYYVLRQICKPDTDSSGRPLFLPADIEAIERFRQERGRKAR